jgi:iron-sulfur cluster assembly enzyme ISCU, mitochondrial
MRRFAAAARPLASSLSSAPLRPAAAVSRNAALRPLAAAAQQSRAYHEKVIDHYEHPRNVGSMDKTAIDVGTGLVGAPGEPSPSPTHFHICL